MDKCGSRDRWSVLNVVMNERRILICTLQFECHNKRLCTSLTLFEICFCFLVQSRAFGSKGILKQMLRILSCAVCIKQRTYIIPILMFYVEEFKVCLLKEGFIRLAQILAFH